MHEGDRLASERQRDPFVPFHSSEIPDGIHRDEMPLAFLLNNVQMARHVRS
jgi:hypothetical protein